MSKVTFEVEAKKYFEADADSLEKVKDGDVCLITIDFEDRRADYVWYNPNAPDSIDRNPANFSSEPDDFFAVVQLWEELGRPAV